MGCLIGWCRRRPALVRMKELEREIYEAAGIPMDAVRMRYVPIEMSDGTKHEIWTVVVDALGTPPADIESNQQLAEKEDRPTLVLTHGYGSASCHLVLLLPELMKHFRIVLFDNLSFGSNSKAGQCKINRLDGEQVDAWLSEYWSKWVDACDELPKKFMVAAHSFGGYQAALFVSKCPERVRKVLFLSPPNFVNFDEASYTPYAYRMDDSPNPPPRWFVTRAMRDTKRDRPLYANFDWISSCLLLWLIRRKCR